MGRLRLANEECGMRWLLEGLSRLATVQGGRGWMGYVRGGAKVAVWRKV